MNRSIRLIVGGLALVALTGGAAQAQYYYPSGYGYNGFGFGGWGATPQGNIAAGLGAYARGEGVYNYDTAAANSIDEDTVVRYNQYLYNSMLESRRRYNREHAARLKMDDKAYQERSRRIRENPSKEDIDSGDTMNAILDQLADPRIMHGSSLRLANATVPAAAIKDIPFRDETDAITLSLDEMTEPKNWPVPLQAEEFRPQREAYQKAIDDALAEDKEGSIKPETVARVRDAVSSLYQKVNDTIPKTRQPDHLQASNYLKGLAGMSRMLEKPNVDAVLSELEKVKDTTVGNLLAFMQSYSLRFAPATTTKQRAVYRQLAPMLADAREKLLGKPGDAPADPAAAPKDDKHPTALFHGFDATHLNPPADPPKQP